MAMGPSDYLAGSNAQAAWPPCCSEPGWSPGPSTPPFLALASMWAGRSIIVRARVLVHPSVSALVTGVDVHSQKPLTRTPP
jgi:hypothetical protein